VQVAELDERPDNTWLRGLEFDQELCATGGPKILSMPCDVVGQAKDTRRGYDTEYVDPFMIYQGYECSAGGEPIEEVWNHADALFERGWVGALERAIWAGVDQDGNAFRMSLAGSPQVVDLTPGGGPVDLTTGVSALEKYMSRLSCRPTLHLPVEASNFVAERMLYLFDADGNIKGMVNGSKVSVGYGYPNTGPAGAAPSAGATWLFISGSLRITTGPKLTIPERGKPGEGLDMTVNDMTVFVEKGFGVQIGCGVAAIQVVLKSCCA
jgi:hypothetical protein